MLIDPLLSSSAARRRCYHVLLHGAAAVRVGQNSEYLLNVYYEEEFEANMLRAGRFSSVLRHICPLPRRPL